MDKDYIRADRNRTSYSRGIEEDVFSRLIRNVTTANLTRGARRLSSGARTTLMRITTTNRISNVHLSHSLPCLSFLDVYGLSGHYYRDGYSEAFPYFAHKNVFLSTEVDGNVKTAVLLGKLTPYHWSGFLADSH